MWWISVQHKLIGIVVYWLSQMLCSFIFLILLTERYLAVLSPSAKHVRGRKTVPAHVQHLLCPEEFLRCIYFASRCFVWGRSMTNMREICWIKCSRGRLYPYNDFYCEIGLEELVNNGGKSIVPVGGNEDLKKFLGQLRRIERVKIWQCCNFSFC